jgi:hypothetical protein
MVGGNQNISNILLPTRIACTSPVYCCNQYSTFFAGFTSSRAATEEIEALVNSVKSQVEGSKGVKYSKFNAISYRSQVWRYEIIL